MEEELYIRNGHLEHQVTELLRSRTNRRIEKENIEI